ncbi:MULTISPECIES: acetyl-CoA hydrolase/transferase family protein [Virgibacillus]|uniref:Acetyl-CoA hydrolase n=1 Tax=Virgibacillus pantothenticus TaxID=1473 RepID=A0A0L0QT98_VIRPA|nr:MULTISPECIES: acetyl-CoA hydrolase/transferase family protein [Virgibacillus]API91965.1 acetyl-CoA hydrolase [Virgibacillus sp. 6R]KNE21403.1 acetyl-CoA hydrolase [Virgibacillus pantothenticus]MBS7430418.1 acetyl-CoA hydrolase/transferase family protein [Virgibacillus sp. 19R1-5]MBU8566356.1 acetyl-CoA hydrolase/transferase family protein [Virgibacillus pantothenticus]MBU8600228.1 acetyl-CoA hydrolase/transferase family protein [Virgibacillus pantothenticus]
MGKQLDRIGDARLHDRIVSAETAAAWIQDGMTLGLSGFTRAGDVKAVPTALIRRAKSGEKLKVNVFTGASLGSDIDKMMAEAGMIHKRLPFQADPTMRKKINAGEHLFVDHHLSHTAEMVRANVLEPVDYAILEAISVTDDGQVIPTTSIGNSLVFAEHAKAIIIEINTAQSTALKGVHDLYSPNSQGEREPIPLKEVEDRIGTIGIPIDIDKVKGIVFTNQPDSPSTIVQPDQETEIMAGHLLDFLRQEIDQGRLTEKLAPLQSGIGSVANAVLHGMIHSEFKDLEVYSEVLQDAVFDLIDADKVSVASCCSITLSNGKMQEVFSNFDKYRDKIIMRPQEISNHPEIIRRLGIIAINTALEADIYGNVNSTHVSGTKMMNGIGGSGDFARNARLAIFVTKSIAKQGDISSIVPFVSHVDHTEHDVDVLVTEQGYADLRGLAPRERVPLIIENCAHPMYREQLWDYYREALKGGGQTPHNLEKAFSWHMNYAKNGTMRELVGQR